MARIYLMSVERTIGEQAMQKVYDLAEVPADDRPPPNNYARQFDFVYMGAINTALGQMYGYRGEHALTTKAGHDSFTHGLAEYGPITGASDLALKAISLKIRMRIGLKAITETMTKFSDQTTTIEDGGDYFIYTIHRCPVCWGRQAEKPICYSSISLLDAGLRWISRGKHKFKLEEVACHAVGDKNCIIHIWKEPIA